MLLVDVEEINLFEKLLQLLWGGELVSMLVLLLDLSYGI